MLRALSFLTPLGGGRPPDTAALAWFPVVGGLIGLCVGGVWAGGQHLWPPLAAAGIALAADALFTGGLHLDGLADAGDGLLPALPRERRLEVMADPRVGAFGLLAVAVVLLLRFGALASAASVAAVAGLWCASRTASAVVVLMVRYSRPGGLAAAFAPQRPKPARAVAVVAIGMAFSLPLVFLGRGAVGAAALAGELAVFLTVIAWARRRIGGYTGDVLGAAIVVGETAGLLVLAARW
jgi:adenosylcobinamide-GDP ribazoletransferase